MVSASDYEYSDRIEINWEPVEHADYYEVWREMPYPNQEESYLVGIYTAPPAIDKPLTLFDNISGCLGFPVSESYNYCVWHIAMGAI